MWEKIKMIEINYFGYIFDVPEETVAVATDPNGTIYAYKNIPKLGHTIWFGSAIYAVGRFLELKPTWEKSLHIIKRINN